VIGEQRALRAFFRCEEHDGRGLDVELREMPPTTDPRSGGTIWVPPVVILWVRERPLAVRVRTVIALNSFAPMSELATQIEGFALAHGLPVEQVCEAGLWRLFQGPPRLQAAAD
jgi:hypothetical protein